MKPIIAICLFCFALELSSPAQGIFQAYLSTPIGGEARLNTGRFWCRVNGGEMEFVAIAFQSLNSTTPSLEPVLSVAGNSIEFSLGDGAFTAFHGAYTYADRNPFIPFQSPFQYDDYGNIYLIDVPSIRYGWLYQGSLTLPEGFEAGLLAGNGTVQLSKFLAGSIAPVPEPSTFALVATGVLLLISRFRRE